MLLDEGIQYLLNLFQFSSLENLEFLTGENMFVSLKKNQFHRIFCSKTI